MLACHLLATALLTASVMAASPQLSRITPAGAQRGTEVEIQLSGARLGDAQALLLNEPGIEVKQVEPVKDNQVKVRLALGKDCPLGPHGLRLRTATGISNLLTFSVGTLPELSEAEPNSDFDKPQEIPLDCTVNGVVENEDVDYFVVQAKKGERVSVEVEGLRLGESFFDPHVAILAPNRFVLAADDDTPLVRQDAAAAITASEDGPLIVEVRESAFGGSNRCRYRLHVGRFPRPLGVFPAGGRPGETVEVEWIGDPKGNWKQQVALPAPGEEDHLVFALDGGGIAPSANLFRLNDLSNVIEAEPNNVNAEATSFEGPAALNGRIAEPGDSDRFRFTGKKGQAYHIRVYARQLRSPLDSVLSVQRSKGQNVASNDDSNGPDSYIRFSAPEDDEYVITVRDHLGQGGPLFFYRIEVVPILPEMTVGVKEFRSFVDTTIATPQGNRAAAMLTVQRTDFGGDVNLSLEGLPAGLTYETVSVADGETAVPVLFSAAAETPLAGSLASVVARHETENRKVEGRLRQRTSMVRGQNNREIWNYYSDRLATGVTEPAPFRIEILEPRVPLVRNGSMLLRVKAERDEGFDGPINLRMIYNPAGVSSPTSVTIPKGQAEGVIPLTANGNAKIRDWSIVVVGRADAGQGELAVASQMAKLAVVESFFKLTLPAVAVEQGAAGGLAVGVESTTPFDGEASIVLVGLPNEVTAEPKTITKDSKEVVFTLATTGKSPPGNHKTLRCQAVVTQDGEPITHILGPGELRILKPAPKKPAAEAKPTAKPKPVEKKPAARPLSRLEQLRQAKQGGS
jgi:pre-peptidase